MSPLARIAIAAIVISSCAVSAAGFLIRGSLKSAVTDSCQLVKDHFYDSQSLQSWLPRCLQKAEHLPWTLSPRRTVDYINLILGELPTSHLILFTPVEEHELWGSTARETGVRVHLIDSHFVITAILPNSPNLNLHLGDEILLINGSPPTSIFDVQKQTGLYVIRRGEKKFSVHVTDLELIEDDEVKLIPIDQTNAILKISSFLPQYFENTKALRAVFHTMQNYPHLILDLRDNNGGSFPAMLRALSPFLCEPTWIGSLRAGSNDGPAQVMKDDLDVESQLTQLGETSELRLETFTGYGCYEGHVTVLIDAGTSSTGEVFSEVFLHSLRTRVWGLPSAGQVVMAEWFPVPALGDYEYSLAIPIADYQTKASERIEGTGVIPQQSLHYDLQAALRGEDSWIQAALLKPNSIWRISF